MPLSLATRWVAVIVVGILSEITFPKRTIIQIRTFPSLWREQLRELRDIFFLNFIYIFWVFFSALKVGIVLKVRTN